MEWYKNVFISVELYLVRTLHLFVRSDLRSLCLSLGGSARANGESIQVNAEFLGGGVEAVLLDGLKGSGTDSELDKFIAFLPPQLTGL